MARPSLALFLATAGLVAGTLGCGRGPESMEGGEGGEQMMERTSPDGESMMDEGGEGG